MLAISYQIEKIETEIKEKEAINLEEQLLAKQKDLVHKKDVVNEIYSGRGIEFKEGKEKTLNRNKSYYCNLVEV